MSKSLTPDQNPKEDSLIVSKAEDDGLTVSENEDGTFIIEWDKEDPRWSMFNDFTEQDFIDMITSYCKTVLDEHGVDYSDIIEEDDL
jgi:hypothetical protein